MIRGRNMTTGALQRAWLFGLLLVFFLPKRVECTFPGEVCTVTRGHDICKSYELEPFGFYGIELLAHRNIGFAYSVDTECR